MKKILLISAHLLIANILIAQNNEIEKSIFNIQTGLLGTWISNESRLTDQIALRSELGLDAAIFGGQRFGSTKIYFAPVLTIEPRWYYNFAKRTSKNRYTANNSLNFFTITTSYHPDWFIIPNNIINVENQISIIPKWGIRRTLFQSKFHYECGIGIGYERFISSNASNNGSVAIDIHLRIGFNFKINVKNIIK